MELHKRNMIAPIIITAILILYYILYVALLLGVGGIISYLIYKRKVKSS